MSLFDFIFLLSVVATTVVVVRIAYFLIRRRWHSARRTTTRLAIFTAVYLVTLVGFSLAEPEKQIPTGTPQCFDDWCITVVEVSRQPAIGATHANGVFYIATVRIGSRSKGRSQRETDVRVYLFDENRNRYDVSGPGQQALERAGLAGVPLTSFASPGGSFASRLAFDLPATARPVGLVKSSWSWFPVRLVIGDPQSWLHRPTVVPVHPIQAQN